MRRIMKDYSYNKLILLLLCSWIGLICHAVNLYAANQLSMPSVIGLQSQTLSIPITLTNENHDDIQSLDIVIGYESSIVTPNAIFYSNTILDSQNYLFDSNITIPGEIYVSFASSNSIYTSTGLLFTIDVTLIGTANEASELTFLTALINDNPISTIGGFVSITPNVSPTIAYISPQSVDEDSSISIPIVVDDLETDPCDLTVWMASSNLSMVNLSNVSLSGTCANRVLLITPTSDQFGELSMTVSVSDGNLTTTTGFTLTVNPVNDMPEITQINDLSTDELTSVSSIPFTIVDIDSGQLTVTVTSSNQELLPDTNIELSSSGNQYSITLNPVTGQAGGATITVSVNDGISIASDLIQVTINPVYLTISGHVSYYTNIAGSSVEGVLMTLSGTQNYSSMTDINGDYVISNIRPGNYSLSGFADNTNMNLLNISDAITILRATARLTTFNCYERIAADVTLNGLNTAMDASMVARYVAGLESCLNSNCKEWIFLSSELPNCDQWPPITYETGEIIINNLRSNLIEQDFMCIMLGDVSE